MHAFLRGASLLLVSSVVLDAVRAACVPDFPEKLLADARVLRHSAVQAAFERIAEQLAGLYEGDAEGGNGTRDGLSFAIVGLFLCGWC
jgi:hypothetical protein